MKVHLTLLTREGCHLCEEYAEELLAYCGDRVELQQAEVGGRIDWLRDYGKRIPVLLDEQGRVVGEGRFDPARIEGFLRSR